MPNAREPANPAFQLCTECAFKAPQPASRVFAQLHAQHTPAALRQGLKIAQSLRLDQLGEAIVRFRHGQGLCRLIHELHEKSGVRSTLVELPRGMQEPRTVAERCGEQRLVAQSLLNGFERRRRRVPGGQVCLNRNVVALLCFPEPAGDRFLKSCNVRRWNGLRTGDGLRLSRHGSPRQVLRQLNVRLIEGLNANHRSRGGYRYLPTEEFLPEVAKIGG